MKTFPFRLLLACSLATLTLAHATEEQPPAGPVADESAGATNLWTALKDHTYDQRELFFTGLKGLEARVDAQIAELAAKRADMADRNTSTQAWDFAMQDLGRARTTLLSTSTDMTKADRTAWNQAKDKVGLAWVWTQDACAKVKASTTN